MKIEVFLQAFYRGLAQSQAWLVLWTKTETRAFAVADIPGAAAYALASGQSKNLYFSPGLQQAPPAGRARGEARTVVALPALWLDIDVAGGAHAKLERELPTQEQAAFLLEQAPFPPSAVIRTGGGVHAYWLLNEPWQLHTPEENASAQDLSRRFQRFLIHCASNMGCHLDNTSSLNQLLRLPGTLNFKYDPPKMVELELFEPERRYSPDEIAKQLPADPYNTPQGKTAPKSLAGAYTPPRDFPPADLELIEGECAFMAYCRDNAASLSEPFWFAQASIIARCKDAQNLFYARSAPHPGYNQAEAEAKLAHASGYGPRTCRSIFRDLGFDGCENCVFRMHIVSPISLGDDSPVAQAKLAVARVLTAAQADPGAAFTGEALTAIWTLSNEDRASWMRTREGLKDIGVPLKKLDEALKAEAQKAKASGKLYRVEENAIMMEKVSNHGVVDVRLSNFACAIIEEITRDDGAERVKFFLLKGTHESGQPLPDIEVSVQQFASLNWVLDQYGSKAVIFSGCRDHFRTAVQVLSESVTFRDLFTHTGWRRINDAWAFLHGGGALGPNGSVENVEVDLGEGGLKDFVLQIPANPQEAKAALVASLQVLDLAPMEVMAPLVAALFLSPLGPAVKIDFSVFLAGLTGTRKSEVAAILQGHFGPEFSGKNLPANWTSTENSLEKQCFLSKDVLTVVDDFNPIGSQYDVNAYHKKADRLLRGQGNQAGRQRMRADGSLRPTYFARGLILGTGEDIPRGQSLRARVLVLEVQPGDVNLEVLTKLQAHRQAGTLTKVMAAYLQWLAPQMDDLIATLPSRKQELRQEALEAGKAHSRTPDIIAVLIIGIETFIKFALEQGAIDQERAQVLWATCRDAIYEAARRQASLQDDECPVQRFLDLLRASLSGGSAHLEAVKGGVPKTAPEAYGWREVVQETNGQQVTSYRPLGKRAGWVDVKGVYLDMDVAFGVAQSLASSQGNTISIGQKTLQKRMSNKNIIAGSDPGTNTKRLTLGGVRRRVIHLSPETLYQDIGKQRNELQAFARILPQSNEWH